MMDLHTDHVSQQIDSALNSKRSFALKFQQFIGKQLQKSIAYNLHLEEDWIELGQRIGELLHFDMESLSSSEEKLIDNLREKARYIADSYGKEAERVVQISFVFVSLFSENLEDVDFLLRIAVKWKTKWFIHFVETTGRTYASWVDFVYQNKYPPCYLVYPVNGVYTLDHLGNVQLKMRQSAHHSLSRRLGTIGDYICGLGLMSGLLFSGYGVLKSAFGDSSVDFFNHYAFLELLAIPCGIWAIGRSIFWLFDRNLHWQTTTSKETLPWWLTITTFLASFSVSSNFGIDSTIALKLGPTIVGCLAYGFSLAKRTTHRRSGCLSLEWATIALRHIESQSKTLQESSTS